MSKLQSNLLKILSYYIVIIFIWVLAFFFLFSFQVNESSVFSIYKEEDLENIFFSGIIAGLIWGSIFKLAKALIKLVQNFLFSVIGLLLVNISSAYLLLYAMYRIGNLFSHQNFPEDLSQLLELYNSQTFYAILFYFFIVGSLIDVFNDVDRKLGKGMLLKFLFGKYYTPVEEERIFLFMDLKSSTYYAEKLGHFKYSGLIQDCFKDISEAVNKNQAEIYQFVGDEVVLTWKLKKGIKNHRCLHLYFDFVKQIESRGDYYQKNYGMIPIFKGGIHSGKVMVAQVGELKTEIAYHGDAINAASRIQELCNQFDERFLLSGDLVKKISDISPSFQFSSVGFQFLKGRQIPIEVFTLNREREC